MFLSEYMIVYKNESYKIIGAALKVYNMLGPGFLEAVYQEALELELQRQGIPYEREKELKIYYDGIELKQTYRADFVCYDKLRPFRVWTILTVHKYTIISEFQNLI